ncbi:MAG: CRISPR-associated endonuclease Cas2 [Staphylococcus sp.]|nr:CRISPR-associated endonuclease Cas2 [Staphylococcus sp.]
MSYRFMRSILFFDLPTLTAIDQRNYRKFVKEIKKLGFYMIQESVYVKMSIDYQVMESMIKRVKSIVPSKGNIMVLSVTEKQFSQLKILVGDNKTDVVTTDERTLVL